MTFRRFPPPDPDAEPVAPPTDRDEPGASRVPPAPPSSSLPPPPLPPLLRTPLARAGDDADDSPPTAPAPARSVFSGHLPSEDIAERARQALTPRRPEGTPASARRVPSPSSGETSQPGQITRRVPDRRPFPSRPYDTEEAPLEPYFRWSSFFALLLALFIPLLRGKSLGLLGLPLAVTAVSLGVYGIVAGRREGNRRSIPAAALGIVLAIGFVALGYGVERHRPPVLAVQAMRLANPKTSGDVAYLARLVLEDFESLARALKRYHREHSALPPAANGNLGINANAPSDHPAFALPTFRTHGMAYDQFAGLTTPVAYVRKIPHDRFAPTTAIHYAYFPTPEHGFALLLGTGPDREYRIDPPRDFRPGDPASRERLLALRWDPTNGTVSRGDLWYVVAFPAADTPKGRLGLPPGWIDSSP